MFVMEKQEARANVEARFRDAVDGDASVHSAQLLVHSDSRGIHWNLAHGGNDDVAAEPGQPYHAASVGKTFTATLIAMLVERGALRFEDPIAKHLPEEILDGLHVYRETDYTDEIRIDHLLSHRSGLPHFHEEEYGLFNRKRERAADGRTFFDVMLADPSRIWEPTETIQWAKTELSPHFPPGDGIYYSEVGYNLLGLIVENATGTPYHEALHEHLFDPLGMDRSYLPPFTEPAVESELPVAEFYVDDRAYDVEEYRSFSAWYAGGQTVNTAEDLLEFHRALVEGELVGADTLDEMRQWQKLYMGIDYGYGTVRLRPVPLLSKYYSWGGLGATSSFAFYNPALDAFLVGTFNQWSYMRNCMKFLFRTLRTLAKIDAVDRSDRRRSAPVGA